MAEQKNAQQTVREQYKVAENMLRTWSDLAVTTADLTFESFQKSLGYSQEARAQADRLANEVLTNYRRMYEDGLKSWQGYVQGVSEILNRTNQA